MHILAVMRKHQRSKSQGHNAINTKTVLTAKEKSVEIHLGDFKAYRLTDSSDTDDNAPPEEPSKLPCEPKYSKKLLPTLLPSHFIDLNYVPTMPPHLRKIQPSRPRILKSPQCTYSCSASYREHISDSSSEDESESQPTKLFHPAIFYQPQLLFRPKSAPTAFGGLKQPAIGTVSETSRMETPQSSQVESSVMSSAPSLSSSPETEDLVHDYHPPARRGQGLRGAPSDKISVFSHVSPFSEKPTPPPPPSTQTQDTSQPGRILLEEAVNRLLGFNAPRINKLSKSPIPQSRKVSAQYN